MAEALALGASIIAVIQISDRIIDLTKHYIRSVRDAPRDLHVIRIETSTLKAVFESLKFVHDSANAISKNLQNLASQDGAVEGCRDVVSHLEILISPEVYTTMRKKQRKIQASLSGLAWSLKESEARKLLDKMARYKTTIILALSSESTQASLATKASVNRLHKRLDNREHQDEQRAILDWLTPIDYASQQNDFIGRLQTGTGQWLTDSAEFQAWLKTRMQTLYCPGIPGAGKTILTSSVIDHLLTKFENCADIGIAYLYCDYQQTKVQNAEALLSSLLKQLTQKRLTIPDDVKSLYEYNKTKGIRPSFDRFIKALKSAVQSYSRVFIVIDALDEFFAMNERDKLLSKINHLQKEDQINLFVTSRYVSEIMSQFEGCISIEIRACDDDILRYVNGRIPQLLRSRISKYPDLQDAIRNEVVKSADGMFLLAQLYMNSLSSKLTCGDIKQALQNMPRGVKGLDTMYEQAMKRINSQEEGFRENAKRVLSWVTHAMRPLTIAELQHALAVRADAIEMNNDFFTEVEDLISICSGLITIDEKSKVIRWIHHTTQEYFERTWMLWLPHAQEDIARACVTYLSFNAFKSGFCLSDEEFETRLLSNVLYDYAARNWGYHVRAASIEGENLIQSLLKDKAKIFASGQAMMASRNIAGYSQRVPRQMTGLHIAAYFGLREAIAVLLENGYSPDLRDSYDRTPLSWAAANGHEAIVELLLANPNVDPDSKDCYGRTPLWLAATNGNETAVKFLLARDGVDIGCNDIYVQTPLSRAAEKGFEAIVRQLLTADRVDLNSKDIYGRTALSCAAENGHDAIVKLLLTKCGVDLDSQENHSQTPLSRAAAGGHETVVQLLLTESGVDVNSKDSDSRTPLWWAAANKYETVVKLLLAKDGINPNSKDRFGWTPLARAAWGGDEVVVKLLIAKDGVDLHSRDNFGNTPLSWAAGRRHRSLVKLILAKDGVDPVTIDKYSQMTLFWMAARGSKAVELLCAKNDVDLGPKTCDGRAPL